MEDVIIYHNPNCATSRNVLAMIRQVGIEPTIIEYLQTPPTEETLKALLAQMQMSARELLRTNVPEFDKHGLADVHKTEQEIMDAMIQDPILINRPVVVTEKGTALCRPSEVVLSILPIPLREAFVKEDGEVVSPN
ncbi:arsenate reductase (glutaredoxin) [Streptococcus ovis]|uniref:arsenate reductase (glutaredoxin) n=1 Tax=Streptococcus ovis TaxID=82806 RepID=UPI00037C2437|nr:arsenate reductase (glutaredoxin) [Streptococcus ovis]